jgi:hypothetical protein
LDAPEPPRTIPTMSEELIEFYGRGGRAGAATAPEGEGGRPHQVRVLLTAAERDELRDRAAAVGGCLTGAQPRGAGPQANGYLVNSEPVGVSMLSKRKERR